MHPQDQVCSFSERLVGNLDEIHPTPIRKGDVAGVGAVSRYLDWYDRTISLLWLKVDLEDDN